MKNAADILKINKIDVHITNVDKLMFPKAHFSKGDVINYYIKIHKSILPHLKNRPVTLLRFPNGIDKGSFYEKEAPSHTPDWVSTCAVPSKTHGRIHYILINDLQSLVWVANLANLEMHSFLSHAPNFKRADMVVFDLDPGPGKSVLDCGELALKMKEVFDRLNLSSYAKVSGSKGMQLYIPLNSGSSFDETSLFAQNIAQFFVGQLPDLVVSKMRKTLRENKILIDWSQNSSSKTTVCPYSLRAKKEQPYVAAPVDWSELKRLLKKGDINSFYFTPEQVLRRLEAKGEIFSPLLTQKQKLPAAFKLAAKSKPRPTESAETKLKEYKKKRDFKKTAEPPPKIKPSSKSNKFVIQWHDASHLHYDFRLEMDGVLKSWAVPKGPPLVSGDRRLAMQVEDHPVDYASFEGIIPKGNYGGGTVMVWDQGTYEVESSNPSKELKAGKLDLVLNGSKLKGKWVLVKDKKDPKRWLMLKGKSAKVVGAKKILEKSVLSKRTMAQIAKDKDAVWK